MAELRETRQTSDIAACSNSSLCSGVSQLQIISNWPWKGRPDTFLPFMKYGRTRVVNAFFLGVGEGFPTPIVNTCLSHVYVTGS